MNESFMNQQTNLLVILSDQLRRRSLSCYGDPNIVTPNIDRLASEGVVLDNAVSTYPVCVPFRFSFMTGESAHSRDVPSIDYRMSPAERTLADVFNDGGYHTAYVGKWHLNGRHVRHKDLPGHRADLLPVLPKYQGRWQKWLGFELANNPHDTHYFEDDDPTPRKLPGYQTDGLFDLAMNHLQKGWDRTRPFACVLSVEPPHFPLQAPSDLEEKWLSKELKDPPNYMKQHEWTAPWMDKPAESLDEADIRRKRRLYYAMVENLDNNVGRMIAFLENENLLDDTVVVFLADHGEMQGAKGLYPQEKSWPFEESNGIPFIVRDPRHPERAGQRLSAPINTEDIYPTLAGLLDIDPRKDCVGTNCAPWIRGLREAPKRPGVIIENVKEPRSFHQMHGVEYRGLRTERYKYVVYRHKHGSITPWLLFDLHRDPYEENNLANRAEHAVLQKQLADTLLQTLKKTEDGFLLTDRETD